MAYAFLGRSVALTTALTVLGLGWLTSSAQASAIQTQTFSASDTISDVPGGSVATDSGHSFASLTFNKFDTSVGVLTAVSLQLASTRTQTTVLTGTPPSGSGSIRNNGSNSFNNVSLTAPGIAASIATITQSGSCGTGGTNPVACPHTIGPVNTATNGSWNGSLANFAGSGTFGVSLKASTQAGDGTSGGAWPNAKDKYTAAWSGSVSAKYIYDQHADASFNSSGAEKHVLKLDFGQVQQGAGSGQLLFDIFNMLLNDPNADARLAMNFDPSLSSITGDGSVFNFDQPFTTISALKAGKGKAFVVSMDTSHTGQFTAVYTLAFADQMLGAGKGVGYGDTFLTLDITGDVVPEPATLALLAGGMLLLGGVWSRRRA